jgi:hypothetical protein
MKTKILASLFQLISIGLLAQNAELRGTLNQGFGDLGTIKIQADQGNAAAQIKLADAYLSNFKSSDALKWYEAAAKQNSVEGEYQLGALLLFGRVGIPKEQQVQAKPIEGLKWTYMAAISSHKEAWRNMAKALQSGIGCSTNLVEAYAWLSLLADTGDIVGRVEMNNLALKLSNEEILRGKSMTQEMKAGHWPQLSSRLPIDDSAFKIGSIVIGKKSLVIINNHTLSEGDQFRVSGKQGAFNVTCVKIETNSVQVQMKAKISRAFYI